MYSIDESFIGLTGDTTELVETGHRIRAEVMQSTGVPVRVAIAAAVAEAKKAVTDAKDAYASGLKPQLDALAGTLDTISGDIAGIRDSLAGSSSRLAGAAGSVRTVLTESGEATTKLATSLNETADKFGELQRAIAKAADTGDLSEISEIIGAGPAELATSLAEPVRVDRTAVFPIVGFGAGMASLYSVLALWVGALLMTVTIRVDVNQETLPDRPGLTTTQKYLGRYGVFALVGLAQSTPLTLGLALFVQIEPTHPLLLILAGWVISLVFTLIVYTFVVPFGNAGKALAVLLLVIQISGSGGGGGVPARAAATVVPEHQSVPARDLRDPGTARRGCGRLRRRLLDRARDAAAVRDPRATTRTCVAPPDDPVQSETHGRARIYETDVRIEQVSRPHSIHARD